MAGGECGNKTGGTPVFSSPEAFGGSQQFIDIFSYGRVVLFVCLDYCDFLQLVFMPIKKTEDQEHIHEALNKFKVFKEIKKCISPNPNDRVLEDVSSFSPLKISRQLLIDAGIPDHWFIESRHGNEIQKENFNLRDIE